MTFMPLSRNASAEAESNTLDADKIAGRIEAAGMSGVAVVLLHAFRPLAWMSGQMLWVLQPFLHGLGTGQRRSLSGLASLLESDHGVDELTERLEGQKAEGRRQKAEGNKR